MRNSAILSLILAAFPGVDCDVFDAFRSLTKRWCDEQKGADANSCKIIAGHHSFNGSATSFVQRTGEQNAAPAPSLAQ